MHCQKSVRRASMPLGCDPDVLHLHLWFVEESCDTGCRFAFEASRFARLACCFLL